MPRKSFVITLAVFAAWGISMAAGLPLPVSFVDGLCCLVVPTTLSGCALAITVL